MTALADLQADFARYLLRDADGSAAQPLVRVAPGIDAAARMNVYRHAYRERLHETLCNDYPVLRRLMGDAAFAGLAYACIDAHRSASPNIRWYGGVLPDIAAGRQPWQAAPALAAMARFEWAIGLAFDAADAPALAVDALAQVPAADWAGLGFILQPALRQLVLSHAVADWWLAVRDLDDAAVLPPPPGPLPAAERNWAIWRGEHGVRFRLLDPDEAAALQAVQDGGSFGALCDLLVAHAGAEGAAPRAAGLLRVWVDAGWISGLR